MNALTSADIKQKLYHDDCNFILLNDCNQAVEPAGNIAGKLTSLCMLIDSESLFIAVFHYSEIRLNDPRLLENLAFYAYPHFNVTDKRSATDTDVKKCIQILNELRQEQNIDGDENSIDTYVDGVR